MVRRELKDVLCLAHEVRNIPQEELAPKHVLLDVWQVSDAQARVAHEPAVEQRVEQHLAFNSAH